MPTPRTGPIEVLIVWVVSYVFFLLNLANNFSASHDSINYLLHITRGEHLFHQHHLLYHYVANQWLHLWQPLLVDVPEHLVVESFTALFGSGIISVCYLFLRNRFALERSLAAAGVAVICCSYGAWFYSVNVEVYAPPIFFVLMALFVMTRDSQGRYTVAGVALLQAAAILFHQVNVLFAFVAVPWIINVCSGNTRWRALLVYCALLIGICGSAYIGAGWFAEGQSNLADFTRWVLGYTRGHNYWQPLSWDTPFKVISGFARAFVGGHFLFQLPPVAHLLQASFANHSLQDELFLTRNMPPYIAWLLTAISAIIGVIVLCWTIAVLARWKRFHLNRRNPGLLILTIVVYSLFFVFWMPEILEFWILQMILVWLILIGAAAPPLVSPHRRAKAVWIIAAALFMVNYAGSIVWLKNSENDWYRVETSKINAAEEDLVIVKDRWILKDYMRYFTKSEVIATDENIYSDDMIRSAVNKTIASGGRVFVYESGTAIPGWKIIQSY